MLSYLLLINFARGFKECSSGSDTAKSSVEFLVTPFFPHKTPRAIKCKYSLSVNYGEYIKLVPDVIDLPCRGKNGIYIEEEGGRSGPFCGPKRMPAFVSRDVRMDIHIIIDTPLGGARVKLGYKAVTSPKGPQVKPARGVKMANMPLAVLKMAPDQGQGQLQQQNLQNRENDRLNNQQALGQGQDADMMGPPGPIGGRHKPKVAQKEWVSETYNPVNNYEPPLINGSSRKTPKSSGSSGVEFVLPILFLMILISILIFVMHKRRQKMKEDLKKLEEKGGSTAHNTIKKDFIPINNGTNSMEKAEPSLEQINHVINANQSAASFESPSSSEPSSSSEAPKSSAKKVVQAPSNKYVPVSSKEPNLAPNDSVSKRDTIEPPPVPSNTLVATPNKKVVAAPSNKIVAAPTNKIQKKSVSQESHDSQATTAPSIPHSEYPKPDRPTRAPVARPSRKANQSLDDDDRPSY